MHSFLVAAELQEFQFGSREPTLEISLFQNAFISGISSTASAKYTMSRIGDEKNCHRSVTTRSPCWTKRKPHWMTVSRRWCRSRRLGANPSWLATSLSAGPTAARIYRHCSLTLRKPRDTPAACRCCAIPPWRGLSARRGGMRMTRSR